MTQHLSDEERAMLGMGTDDEVEFLGEDRAEPHGVAQARMQSTAQLSELLVGPILKQPDFDPVLPELSGAPGFGRWLQDPKIYSLPANAEVVQGQNLPLNELSVVDVRCEPALVRLDNGHERILIRLEGERAVCFRSAPPSRLQVPALPRLESAIEPPALEVEDLLRAEADAWLLETTNQLATSPDALARLAAAGLLLRAWRPVGREAWQREAERVRRGEPGLVQRTRTWMNAVGEARLTALSEAACAEARGLPDQIDALRMALLKDDEQGASVATGLVLARDDLASVHASMALVGRGDALAKELATTDEDLVLHLTAWGSCAAGVRRRIGARIEALVLRESDAYWLRMFG